MEYSLGSRLLEKHQDVIKSIKHSTDIKIVSEEEVEANQAFLAVKKEFDQRFSFFDVNSPISFKYSSSYFLENLKKDGKIETLISQLFGFTNL
jgi:hypothetical protein